MQLLLEHKNSLVKVRPPNFVALEEAIIHGFTDIVGILLKACSDIDEFPLSVKNAVLVACGMGHLKTIELIIKKARFMIIAVCGEALPEAVGNKVAHLLISEFIDKNCLIEQNCITEALQMAVESGFTTLAAKLIDRADIVCGEAHENLRIACKNGHSALVEMLCDHCFCHSLDGLEYVMREIIDSDNVSALLSVISTFKNHFKLNYRGPDGPRNDFLRFAFFDIQ